MIESITNLHDEVMNIKDSLIAKLQTENSNLKSRLYDIEKEFAKNQNHQRRNNLVISGIPVEVEAEDLEPTVTSILSALDITVTRNDINGIRRLRSYNEAMDNKITIVSFTNRRVAEEALANRKKLMEVDMEQIELPADTEIYIKENVCPYTQTLGWKCRLLKNKKKIHSTWLTKGTVFLRLTANSDPIKIEHSDDILDLLPTFIFPSKPKN